MAFKLGLETKLYYDTDGADVTAWVENTNVRDLTLNLETATDDVTTRGGNGFRQTAATLKDGSTDFQMIYDPADPHFAAFKDAFFNPADRVIGIWVADGDQVTSGTQGLKADMMVTNFTINQNLEEAVKVDVTVAPTFSAYTPNWFIVP